ncbi:hypothetical protein DLE54_10810 [Psychrobacter sp. YP14]|jgi:hypothetical protein|uniref:DUF4105 domain-containing protein n=1 Tax=Psychrobacter raelei TaxID=2565531 RepID=A0AAT9PF83_9GAMM|nr:DUF4105 domain-containing protein [Psychrobacter sp. YP14]AWT49946.1 hypothetical protein DLE54_10810 [Psychrobacter sp. YP14]
MTKINPSHTANLTKQLVVKPPQARISPLIKAGVTLAVLLAALWAGLVLWIHLVPLGGLRVIILLVLGVGVGLTLKSYWQQALHWQKQLALLWTLWLMLLMWFVWLPPKQDRHWMPEVSQVLQFTQDPQNPNLITLHNVRNFDWVRSTGTQPLPQPEAPYYYKVASDDTKEVVATERWSERTVDLDKLSGVDIVNSYWMGEQIAHTLLSFRFEDERPLSFSIEIRKEESESFSAFGGFVKQFEMAVVAAEERDIIYTRTNVRGEQVYLLPIEGMSKAQMQALFKAYLQQVKQLQQQPIWYNTLIRNCTTVIFDMARAIDGRDFPWDYRILMSGYVPNYLYDQHLLPRQTENWRIEQWYKAAHINPKVAHFSVENNQSADSYSKQIRQQIPQPALVAKAD